MTKSILYIILFNAAIACSIVWNVATVQWAPLEYGETMNGYPLLENVFQYMLLLFVVNILYGVWCISIKVGCFTIGYKQVFALYILEIVGLLTSGVFHIYTTDHFDVISCMSSLSYLHVVVYSATSIDAVTLLYNVLSTILVLVVILQTRIVYFNRYAE